MSYPPFQRARQHKHVDITTGNYTLAASQSTSTRLTSGPAIVLSNVQVGDVLLATLSGIASAGTSGEAAFDAASIVSSSIQSQFSLGTRPIGLGFVQTTTAGPITGTSSHTVVAGDIDTSGLVTVEITYQHTGSSTGTLFANATYALRFGVVNIGPQDLT